MVVNMETDVPTMSPGERNGMFFTSAPSVTADSIKMDDGTATTARADEDDAFFELTADDLRARQRELSGRVRLETNRPLLTRTYLARKNQALKQRAYLHTVIRFTIQNRVFVQARFLSTEPVSALFDFVRHFLRNSANVRFDLRLARERISASDTRTLLEADLAPASRLILHIQSDPMSSQPDDIAELLDADVLAHVTEEDANNDRQDWLATNSEFRSFERMLCDNDIELREDTTKRAAALILGGGARKPGSSSNSNQPSSSSSGSGASGASVPKWFKKS